MTRRKSPFVECIECNNIQSGLRTLIGLTGIEVNVSSRSCRSGERYQYIATVNHKRHDMDLVNDFAHYIMSEGGTVNFDSVSKYWSIRHDNIIRANILDTDLN